MGKRLTDEQVVVGVRAVALAAGVVLRRLRDPEFLAGASGGPAPAVVAERDTGEGERGRWSGLARQGGQLVRQGGQRARDGVAAGLQRWVPERPGTEGWRRLGVDERTEWWLAHLGRTTAVMAALPGMAGAVGERVPVQDLVSVAGQALLLCAVAGEYGIDDVDEQARLVARVVLGRDVSRPAEQGRREAAREATDLTAGVDAATRAQRATATARSVLAMGRMLQGLQDELDARPRGHLGHRMLGKVPMVGVVGHYQGERRGLAVVAQRGRAWCVEHAAARTVAPQVSR